MLKTNKSLRRLVALGFAILLLFGVTYQPAAQLFGDVQIIGLLHASPGAPLVGDNVQLSLNQSAFLFYNLHLRAITSVEWDFGDGTIVPAGSIGLSTVMNHTYSSPGIYQVRLRIVTRSGAFYTLLTLNVSARTVTPGIGEVQILGLLLSSPVSPFAGQTIQFSVNSSAFLFNSLRLRNINRVEWDFGDGTVLNASSFTMASTMVHTYAVPGTYVVRVRIFTNIGTYFTLHTVNVVAANPAQVGVGTLAQFDFNGDNRLSDAEFFAMIDAWIAVRISNQLFFAGVDVWVADGLISAVRIIGAEAPREARALVLSDGDRVVFSAEGASYERVAIRVYDSNGNIIFRDTAGGNRLVWNLRTANGTLVANGVYYYALDAVAPDGSSVWIAPRAFRVMR